MTNQSQVPPVSAVLAQMDIPHRVYQHSGPVHSLEQAALERGQHPAQIVRSILFRLGSDEYAMVLTAGADQLPWPALRRLFGRSRISMAKRDEVLAVTGYQIGAVSPFGVAQPLDVVIEQRVLAVDEVSIGSGTRGTTVILQTSELRGALPGAAIADLFADPAVDGQ